MEPLIYEESKLQGPVIKMNKVCLVDADFIKHIAFSRGQNVIAKEMIEDLVTIKKVHRAEAIGMCEDLIRHIRDPIVFCFSGKSYNTFRYKLALEKEYKGNRKHADLSIEEIKAKTEIMQEVMESIINNYVCLIFDDLEADDLLSMLQDEDTYIYSKDKDLLQIPGLHYDHQSGKVISVTPDEAYRFLATQLLTGDSTDNICGVAGIGPKNAEKILKDVSPKNLMNAVYRQYKLKYGIIKGTDLFSQNWMLIKLRMNHGEYFMEKYKSAFSLIESIKKNNLSLTP